MTRTVRRRSRGTSVSCSYADRDEVGTAARVIHSPDAADAKLRIWMLTVATLISMTWLSPDVSGQVVHGRVVETGTDAPVALAGVFLLDADREIVRSVLADSVGRFRITAPSAGEYYLLVQRLGYFETESHLVALSDGGDYALDIEVRSEPIRLDPLLVTVRNKEMERWYTLALGVNPNSLLGFRVIQGARLAEARLKATDNTDLLRWLYIPVSPHRKCAWGLGCRRSIGEPWQSVRLRAAACILTESPCLPSISTSSTRARSQSWSCSHLTSRSSRSGSTGGHGPPERDERHSD